MYDLGTLIHNLVLDVGIFSDQRSRKDHAVFHNRPLLDHASASDHGIFHGYDGYMTLEPHTGKYADHKILFQLLCWITWAIPYIGKWHRVFRRIDKAKGVGRWRSVDRNTIFKWQYEGLKSLLKEAGAEV